MPTDKSPGTDGRSLRFYQFFWHDIWHGIKALLISSFHIAYQTILSSWKRQRIYALLKRKKNIRDASKTEVSAERFKKCLPFPLTANQAAFKLNTYL